MAVGDSTGPEWSLPLRSGILSPPAGFCRTIGAVTRRFAAAFLLASTLAACPARDEPPSLRRFEDLPPATAPKKSFTPPPLREFNPQGVTASPSPPPWLAASRLAPAPSGVEPPGPRSRREPSPWTAATPGDWVEYEMQSDGSTPRTVRAEVTEVREGTIWVRASCRSAGGGLPGLPGDGGAGLLVPFSSDLGSWRPMLARGNVRVPTRDPLDEDAVVYGELGPIDGGVDVEAAGRRFDAVKEIGDHRARKGPRIEIIRTAPTGPLYLSRGILSWDASGGGAHPFHERLTLVAFGRGAPAGDRGRDRRYAAAPRVLVRRIGASRPGAPAWQSVSVTALGEGLVTRWQCNPVVAGERAQPRVDHCLPQPRVEDLLGLFRELLGKGAAGHWIGLAAGTAPPGPVLQIGPGRHHAVRTLVSGNLLFAADPWAPALAGAPWYLRFGPLARTDAQAGRVLDWSSF